MESTKREVREEIGEVEAGVEDEIGGGVAEDGGAENGENGVDGGVVDVVVAKKMKEKEEDPWDVVVEGDSGPKWQGGWRDGWMNRWMEG